MSIHVLEGPAASVIVVGMLQYEHDTLIRKVGV